MPPYLFQEEFMTEESRPRVKKSPHPRVKKSPHPRVKKSPPSPSEEESPSSSEEVSMSGESPSAKPWQPPATCYKVTLNFIPKFKFKFSKFICKSLVII